MPSVKTSAARIGRHAALDSRPITRQYNQHSLHDRPAPSIRLTTARIHADLEEGI